jgi:hypothetical protein
VLPHRFRSSALRDSGAGRLATDRSGRLARRAVADSRQVAGPIIECGVESCPQFVVMAAVAPSSLGVAVNSRDSSARQLRTRRHWVGHRRPLTTQQDHHVGDLVGELRARGILTDAHPHHSIGEPLSNLVAVGQ